MLALGTNFALAHADDHIPAAAPGGAGKPNSPVMNLLSMVERGPRLPDFGSRMNSAASDSTGHNQKGADSTLRRHDQTVNPDNVEFEANVDRAAPVASDGSQPVDHFILNQHASSFNGGWRMDNSLGEQRARTQSMVGSGYQYALPDAPFKGMAARGYTHNTEISWVAGQMASIKGKRIKSFETTRGEITGLGARQSLAQHWRLGWQTWMTRDNPRASTRHNLGGAIEYQNPNTHRHYTIHLAQDDKEHWGSWMDNDQRSGAWRQRYGLYRFEPRLRWINKAMADDREGVYWRTDHERGSTAWFSGLDVENTNVHATPTVAGIIGTFGFIGVEQQLNAKTSVGGSIRTGVERQGAGAPAPSAKMHRLKLFLNRDFWLGETHFGAQLSKRASVKKPEEQVGFFLDHIWLDNGSDTFKTSLGLTNITRGDQTFVVPATGFRLAYAVTRHFDLDGSINYLWQDTGNPDDNAASHASLGVSWLVDRHWHVSLGGRWDGDVLKADEANRDLLNRIDFTIAYRPSDS